MARVDPKAKQRRQRIIAAVGGAILLLLLVIQGPKTLKLLNGPEPAATSASATPTTTPADTSDPAVTPTPVAVAAVAVSDSDPLATAEEGQLVSFESFRTKDPFVQQLAEGPTTASNASSSTSAPTSRPRTPPPLSEAQRDALRGTGAGSFTTQPSGGTGGSTKTRGSASFRVNEEAADDIPEGGTFPKDGPVFRLVSVTSADEVEIAIASGSFKGGSSTLTISRTRPTTLINTSNGRRYSIQLVRARP